MRKIRRICKDLLVIYLSKGGEEGEKFLEKYEFLLVNSLKSTNYFTRYAGMLMLSSLLRLTASEYHEAFFELLKSLEIPSFIEIERLFAVLTTSETLVKGIFTKL